MVIKCSIKFIKIEESLLVQKVLTTHYWEKNKNIHHCKINIHWFLQNLKLNELSMRYVVMHKVNDNKNLNNSLVILG